MKRYPLDERTVLEDLQGLMEIRSTSRDCGEITEEMPLGKGVYDALSYVVSLGERYGFRTRMLDGYCCWLEIGQGEKMIAVLTHVDTVPVEAGGWKAAPYGATLLGGKVYGRGICDNKGPTILAIHAMKQLLESGVTLDKRIRLIVGGDEESGEWACMERYKRTEELPACAFSPDAGYPVIYAEKGVLHVAVRRAFDENCRPITVEAGKSYNTVPAAASAVIDGVRYEAEGKAAHASCPEQGVNALQELCAFLDDEGIEHPFVQMVDNADRLQLCTRFFDEQSGALTLNPAIVETDGREIVLKCDLRVPVTIPHERVVEEIVSDMAVYGFRVEEELFIPPLYVERDSPLVATLQEVYREYTGRQDEPISMGGGTYARAFENAVAFGPLLPDEEQTAHETNERWSLANMELTYRILASAMERL